MKCETNTTDLLSFLKIIIFSLSNCHICDDQGLVVITAGKWSLWRTLDGKYLYLHLIPFGNCICISSRQEEGLWVGRVKGAGSGGGGGTTETLCVMDLLHTHPQAAAFAKDQATK